MDEDRLVLVILILALLSGLAVGLGLAVLSMTYEVGPDIPNLRPD